MFLPTWWLPLCGAHWAQVLQDAAYVMHLRHVLFRDNKQSFYFGINTVRPELDIMSIINY